MPVTRSGRAGWARWRVEPVSLRELMEQSDAVCVALNHFTRYQVLLGERYLSLDKTNQVLVSLAPSSLFDDATLPEVLGSGRMAAAWFDSQEPGLAAPGRPLHRIDTLQVTPRVASASRESRVRAAWDTPPGTWRGRSTACWRRRSKPARAER